MIPPWTDEGLLPPGVHASNRAEVNERFGWNSRRQSLLIGIESAMTALAAAGCTELWLDGSFVTTKELPNDWDGCWGWQTVNPALLDPAFIQPWGRAVLQSRYLGDLFISAVTEGRSGLGFVDFFQLSRDGSPKGIVLLNPQEPR